MVCAGEKRSIEGAGVEAHGELQETRWVDVCGVLCSACKMRVNVSHHVPGSTTAGKALCVHCHGLHDKRPCSPRKKVHSSNTIDATWQV